MKKFLSFVLAASILALPTFAAAQRRATTEVAPTTQPTGEGSGGEVQERAYDPRGNEQRQPERNEGNEDDLGSGGTEVQGGN